jgi:hypothetical protein
MWLRHVSFDLPRASEVIFPHFWIRRIATKNEGTATARYIARMCPLIMGGCDHPFFFSRESVKDLNVAIAVSKSGASPYTISR